MDTQTLINIVGGVGFTSLGWFAKELWNAVKELKQDLAKLREELPKQYVPKDDFKDSMLEVKALIQQGFDRLDTKLDKKVDKHAT